MDGMTAAGYVREKDPEVVIVFVTNLAQYAIQGYSVNALDYISYCSAQSPCPPAPAPPAEGWRWRRVCRSGCETSAAEDDPQCFAQLERYIGEYPPAVN